MPVRVKHKKSGDEYTVARAAEDEKELDKPAVDINGRWLEPKSQIDLLIPGQDKATPANESKAEEATK